MAHPRAGFHTEEPGNYFPARAHSNVRKRSDHGHLTSPPLGCIQLYVPDTLMVEGHRTAHAGTSQLGCGRSGLSVSASSKYLASCR